jgi:HD superfamily phosphohydrolase
MAALCHDVGHLPFSHAAEKELLPDGFDHERLTKEIIQSPEMVQIWDSMRPHLVADDIVKLAVGPKKADPLLLDTWESILAEIVIGDAFGADRMDYLLRDSYHTGVSYGKFDHHRLISTLRILPKEYNDTDEPALGLEIGGLESSEGLLVARYFMYKQVYLHPIRRVYDIHLKDFLLHWLPSGKFSTELERHFEKSDVEALTAIRKACATPAAPEHLFARRIQCRDHFRMFYSALPSDKEGGVLIPGKRIAEEAVKKYGDDSIRYDHYPPKATTPDFPVRAYDRSIQSSLKLSQVIAALPQLSVDNVYCDKNILPDARTWENENKKTILNLR